MPEWPRAAPSREPSSPHGTAGPTTDRRRAPPSHTLELSPKSEMGQLRGRGDGEGAGDRPWSVGSPWLHYPGVSPEEVGRRNSLEEHKVGDTRAGPGTCPPWLPPLSQVRPGPNPVTASPRGACAGIPAGTQPHGFAHSQHQQFAGNVTGR